MSEDLPAIIASAQAEVDRTITSDPTYAELMATYVDLGEVLEAGKHLTRDSPADEVTEFEDECRGLVSRLIELGRTLEFESDQRWARWRVQNLPIEEVGHDVVQGGRLAA